MESSLGKWSMYPNYRFSSKPEQDKYKSMFHRRSKYVHKEPTFECVICSKKITGQSSLNWFKLKQGHNRRTIVNADEPPQKRKRKAKQGTINNMLRFHQD